MSNKIRIIGGEWRSRQIVFDDTPGLRPTPGRLRETVFNWLQTSIEGCACLDLYAGSGALGLEAASRGAVKVALVEQNPQACRMIHTNITQLGAIGVQLYRQDVFRFLAGDPQRFDLVFMDPPFGKDLIAQTCLWLEEKGWLTVEAKIYIEAEKQWQVADLPESWKLLKEAKAGDVKGYLFKRN